MSTIAAPGPVVVGFNGTAAACDALRLGTLVAQSLDAPLRPVWVHGSEQPGAARETVERALADTPGETAGLVSVVSSSAPRGLHEEATRTHAAAVVLGSTHRAGIGKVLPGSVATRLLHGAPCAVGVAPREYADSAPPDLRVIQIAFDSSDESWAAVAEGGALAAAAGATVRLFAVVGPPPAGAGLSQTAGVPPVAPVDLADFLQVELHKAVESLPPGLRPDARVLRGDVARHLLAEAEKGVDLLVLGSRGYGPLHYALVGSVSSAVTHDAPCPVLLVPRGGRPADG